ncbi:MAG: ABC transporter substrate-binding protein [Erysipelotrichaceae bacterium]|nr:ABC transporter substrate-binding protein [Erysipelotrichaceae bacterium]
MKKTVSIVLSALMSISLLTGCSNSTASSASASAAAASEVPSEVTITDHADRTVTVPTDPKRVAILSILPLPSMLTIYLDSASSIVAMEPGSMNAAKNGVLSELYPEILNVSTNIMDGNDVNIESLIALEPDIVFYNAGNKSEQEKLENAGLTAVGVSPTKWNYDCIKTYNEWMKLLDQIYPSHASDREDLVDQYSSQKYAEIQEKVSGISEKQKVLFLFQYDTKTMITSSASFFGEWWCNAVGAENAAHDVNADNSNAVISMEQVYAWNPDVIIITNFTSTSPDDLYNNAVGSDDWSTVKAVQDKRVYKMPLGSYRTYTPGVDTPMTLEWLAQAVYPEIFKDYDVASDVKEYYKNLYGVELSDEQVEKMYTPNRAAGKWN